MPQHQASGPRLWFGEIRLTVTVRAWQFWLICHKRASDHSYLSHTWLLFNDTRVHLLVRHNWAELHSLTASAESFHAIMLYSVMIWLCQLWKCISQVENIVMADIGYFMQYDWHFWHQLMMYWALSGCPWEWNDKCWAGLCMCMWTGIWCLFPCTGRSLCNVCELLMGVVQDCTPCIAALDQLTHTRNIIPDSLLCIGFHAQIVCSGKICLRFQIRSAFSNCLNGGTK